MLKSFLLIFITFSIVSCTSSHKKNFLIKNVAESTKHKIEFSLKEGTVEKVKINIKGYVNDTAKIGNFHILPVEVDTTFSQEWYSPDYTIDYNPYKAKKGQLGGSIEFVIY